MNVIAPILLRGILAFALVMGGLPAWGMSAMTAQHDSSIAQDSSQDHKADCHSAESAPQADVASDEPKPECCQDGEGCESGSCRCLCPAPNLVVPVRTATSAPARRTLPASILSAPAPRNVITTLLRPPRA